MIETHQWEDPEIRLVETPEGEVTLAIDGHQAMQAWERELMWASADMLCEYGSEFLEVGLGLGISALRIAAHRNTRRHVVVERYQRVIDLFRERHPATPPSLHIVRDDLFQHFDSVPAASLDGIFFDPFLPAELENRRELWDEFMPMVLRALRPGGTFIPFFTTEPVLKWPFFHYFDRIVVTPHTYTTYPETNYTTAATGTAFIQCFVKAAKDR
jgi:tRNA G46 methylase TrmB